MREPMRVGLERDYLTSGSGNMQRRVATAGFIRGATNGMIVLCPLPTNHVPCADQIPLMLTLAGPVHSESWIWLEMSGSGRKNLWMSTREPQFCAAGVIISRKAPFGIF